MDNPEGHVLDAVVPNKKKQQPPTFRGRSVGVQKKQPTILVLLRLMFVLILWTDCCTFFRISRTGEFGWCGRIEERTAGVVTSGGLLVVVEAVPSWNFRRRTASDAAATTTTTAMHAQEFTIPIPAENNPPPVDRHLNESEESSTSRMVIVDNDSPEQPNPQEISEQQEDNENEPDEDTEPVIIPLEEYVTENKKNKGADTVVVASEENGTRKLVRPRPMGKTVGQDRSSLTVQKHRSELPVRTTPLDPFQTGSSTESRHSFGHLELQFKCNDSPPHSKNVNDFENIHIQASASDFVGLTSRLTQGSGITLRVLIGTLRLLAPLVVARRGLARIGTVGNDWYTGRFLRTTLHKYERNYWKYYQGSAFLRSYTRITIHTILLLSLGELFQRLTVMIDENSCLADNGGAFAWCTLLWLGGAMGLGRVIFDNCTSFGFLRVQERKPQKVRFWQGLRDPEQWLNQFDSNEVDGAPIPFEPKRVLFPATWRPLRAILILAMALEMNRSRNFMHIIMKQVLVQQAFADEWDRAFLQEKRITVGMTVSWFYLLSTLRLFWTSANIGNISPLLVIPSLLAVLVTSWMNVFIFFERKKRGRTMIGRGKRPEKQDSDQERTEDVARLTTSSSSMISLR